MSEKIHYRKAFASPYLGSADIVEPMVFTVSRVALEPDHTKRTKDEFNTAYFVEKEIRPGEPMKPMILNVTNCTTLKAMTGSSFINDWLDVRVTIFCDPTVKYGREVVGGLVISQHAPEKKRLTPENKTGWSNAKAAYKRDGDLVAVLKRVDISVEHQAQLIEEGME